MHGIESLIHLGLTPQEARLYSTLEGRALQATDLSVATGLARSRVYQLLTTLQERGLVAKDGTAYRRLDVDGFIARRQAELCQELVRLERLRREGEEEPAAETRVVQENEVVDLAVRLLLAPDGVAVVPAKVAGIFESLPPATWAGGGWRIVTDDPGWIPAPIRQARAGSIRVSGSTGPCFGSTGKYVHVLGGSEANGVLVKDQAIATQFRTMFENLWSTARSAGSGPT